MEEADIAAAAAIEEASDLPERSLEARRNERTWGVVLEVGAAALLRRRGGRGHHDADAGRGRGGRLATLVGRIARMSTTTADKARIEAQIALIPRLRGTGPNPFDYDQWDARTAEVLTAAFGADSDEVARYQRVVGEAGRVAGVRGNAGNMTLNIHGQWGILERLERAESLLRELAGS